jgi:hypothetical protein
VKIVSFASVLATALVLGCSASRGSVGVGAGAAGAGLGGHGASGAAGGGVGGGSGTGVDGVAGPTSDGSAADSFGASLCPMGNYFGVTENPCDSCPGVSCAASEQCEARIVTCSASNPCESGIHEGSAVQVCACVEGHMGCCAAVGADVNGVVGWIPVGCHYGDFTKPPCPNVRPLDGAPCGPAPNSCDYDEPCCPGGAAAFCLDGKWQSVCFLPTGGDRCGATADAGTDGGDGGQ